MPELSRRDLLRWSALGVALTALSGCGAGAGPGPLNGRIDVHQHMVPEAYRQWLSTRGAGDAGGVPMPKWTASAALASMDQGGTAKALLSVSTPGVTPAGTAAEAADMARLVNDAAAGVVKDRPDRFGFLATVPLPAVDAAVAEAARALDELRADGLILLAHSGDTYLGDAAQMDLFAELDRRRTVVLVHPGPLPGPAVPKVPPLAADFLLDTTRAAYLLVRNGVVARYRGIRFVLSHAGGFLPYAADRIAASLSNDTGLQQWSTMEQLRSFWFDTALATGPTTLPALLAFAQPDHVVFGSDWPFAPQALVDHFTDALDHHAFADDASRQAVNRDNAVALFAR